ncbi:MAG: hypothetical protein M1813_006234, partial [Trichoglossum hirsutum]
MAFLTIIPYNPVQANAYCSSRRPRAKDVFKSINDHDRELRIKPSILPVDTPQPQAIAVADGAGGLTTCGKDSDSISDGDHLSPEGQGSHDSACTSQGGDRACSQKFKDKGAPILISGSEEVSIAKNNDIQIEIDHLSSKGRGSHGSACISQAQDQACSEQYQDKGASISIDEAAGSVENGDPLFAETIDVGDQTYSQQPQDKGASIIIEGPEKVGGVGEDCDIEIEIDSLFGETDDIFKLKNTLMTEVVDGILGEADAESEVGRAEIQDGDVEFGTDDIESEMRNIEAICHPLKRKAKTGKQGSQDNPLVIPDSETESETESFIVCFWQRMIDETDDEASETEFEIGGTRVRTGDAQSENDGEDNRQSHPRPAALSTHYSDFNSALFKSADRIESQSVARVGGNGEWGIYGIIDKEVIEGK